MNRKPLIVSVSAAPRPQRLPFPRVMWADVDPTAAKADWVVIYPTKREQRGNRPDLKPIKCLVVALDDDGQPPISAAIDVLNQCAEQGHKLS
jgi:hypothetical protein